MIERWRKSVLAIILRWLVDQRVPARDFLICHLVSQRISAVMWVVRRIFKEEKYQWILLYILSKD